VAQQRKHIGYGVLGGGISYSEEHEMINDIKMSVTKYESLLGLFPEAWRDKLRIYTGEELFYCYKLCKFKPGKALDRDECVEHGTRYCKACAFHKTGDITYAAIRMKLIRYLKGTLDEYSRPSKPVAPDAWAKLGRKFRWAYEEDMLIDMERLESEELMKSVAILKETINKERVA
jgi:hypothetical protein